MLFETDRDMLAQREYVCEQFRRMIDERVNLRDYVFAKEYRGRGGYRPAAIVPALQIARKYSAWIW